MVRWPGEGKAMPLRPGVAASVSLFNGSGEHVMRFSSPEARFTAGRQPADVDYNVGHYTQSLPQS